MRVALVPVYVPRRVWISFLGRTLEKHDRLFCFAPARNRMPFLADERLAAMVRYSGGCLCGGLRYEATAEPKFAGHCYCADCRKASGSGFIPFMGFSRGAVTFSGRILQHRSKAASGADAVRNSCAICGGLVFGGEIEAAETFNIYAGSLDEPLAFRPTIAIFARQRPPWALIPPGLKIYADMPP